MKKDIAVIFCAILNTLILPAIIVALSGAGIPHKPETISAKNTSGKNTITAYIKNEDKVVTMDLEEYLWGAVSAEMPASFPLEALKAQAVAARSYIINKVEKNGKSIPEHKGADVCTDSAHCKAWLSVEERMGKWAADEREKNRIKIETAISETAGEIMTYGGETVNAVFYAISSGKTESASEVWGGDVPYLKSAESPLDVNAPGYASTVVVSAENFKSEFLKKHPEAVFGENKKDWYSDEIRSEGGGVLTCRIGGVKVKGTEVRSIYGLRSHNFTLKYDGDWIFEVKGYGHGVGMSQWGAKFYAEEGKSYRDILRIYYSGVEFENIGK